jgi:hypothetical protein
MTPWETDPALAGHSPATRDFAALWRAADKVVYSRTLTSPATARTRIEREFDPEAVARLKAEATSRARTGASEVDLQQGDRARQPRDQSARSVRPARRRRG